MIWYFDIERKTDLNDIISSFSSSSSGNISEWEWPSNATDHDANENDVTTAAIELTSPSPIPTITDAPMSNSSDQIQYFNGDILLPIYDQPAHCMATKKVVQIIGTGVPDNRSAKLVPSQPKDNLSFMIASNYLEEWKNVLSDDLGVWTPNGTKTLYYARKFRADDGEISIIHVKSAEEADLTAYRYLYSYPSEKSYKRVVVRVMSKTDDGWEVMPHILLQYYFENGKKEIIASPHGNSKQEAPYIRAKVSTKCKISQHLPKVKRRVNLYSQIWSEKKGV